MVMQMNANQLTKIPVEKLSDTLQFLIVENEIPFSDALKQVIDDVDAVCKKLLRDEPAPAQPVLPKWPSDEVERDALRYRFLRDSDFFGDEDEPGLVGWEGLVELGYNEFDAAVDARISHPDIDYVKLDTALRKHIPAQPVIPEQPEPTISFYRDGIIAAAKWVENQRDAYDNEHGQSDPETGSFEFGNNAQLEYSTTLSEIAEGIRSLHSVSAQPVSEPYKLEIDMDDADHFSITHLHEIIYGKELIWPEAKLLARFMLDVKQRVSAAPAQESE